MVRKGVIERRNEKVKPRGKPFPKDNIRGKPKIKAVDDSGRGSGVKGGVVEKVSAGQIVNHTDGLLLQIPQKLMEVMDRTLKENMETPQEESKETNEVKQLELIESIDFTNGPNKLTIRFSKKHNRMYRIQIFLNEENEIRPVTYSGASTGMTFWKLLKGALKK